MMAVTAFLALLLRGAAQDVPLAAPVDDGAAPEKSPAAVAASDVSDGGNGGGGEVDVKVRRDPFWPVGYEPPPPEEEAAAASADAADAVPEPVIEWPTLRLRGITRLPSGKYIGLLDGFGMVEPGDTIKCLKKGIIYRWEITSVGPEGVLHRRIDATPREKE